MPSTKVPNPGTPAIGPFLAESRDTHDDELRIDLVQPIRAEAHLLQRARPKALDQHRGRWHELEQQLR
jgi:hypothetical protein